jgi:truncated hemoglobin YjbI
LKPEWWGSPLVQEEKYQEKPVKKRRYNNNKNSIKSIQISSLENSVELGK